MTSTGQAREPYPRHGAHAAHARTAGPDPAVAIDVRNQAVGRMRWMNVKHAQHAWEQRYRDPLAAYGLAFLFVQPTPGRAERLTVKAATKLWLAGPETEDLPRLLFDLNEVVGAKMQAGPLDLRIVGAKMQAGPLDLRTQLANRVDNEMADAAYYIGVGLSSLDTHTGVWEQARERVDTVTDVPGRALIMLTDQTIIVCERRGINEFNAFQIHSTHSLGDAFAYGVYRWSWSQTEQLRADPAHAQTLHWLDALNLTLWQADNARLVAANATRSSRRGERGR